MSERLEYERAVYKQKMRAEIAQAKREASHFEQNVERSEKVSKKLKQKKEIIDNFTLNPSVQYKQRKTNDEIQQDKKEFNKSGNDDRTEFLKGLFAS